MNSNDLIKKTEQYVKKTLAGYDASHDWWHVQRVRRLALHLSDVEGGDRFIVELGALLHDIADWKYHEDDQAGPKTAKAWLEKHEVERSIIDSVTTIIKELSFKGAGVATPMSSLEGKIVQDADRLDAIGAIGIARTFAYNDIKKRPLYDPSIKPEQHQSFEAYKKADGPAINHFYEKLLLLKDRMNTKTARQLAQGRHKFMEQFLAEFYAEWDGKH